MVKVETEAPALWRKPPETATPSTLDKRATPRTLPWGTESLNLCARLTGALGIGRAFVKVGLGGVGRQAVIALVRLGYELWMGTRALEASVDGGAVRTMSVAESEAIDCRGGAGGGCRKSRALLTCLGGVVVLGLSLAATGAVAAEGEAAPSESKEAIYLGGPLDYEVIDGLAVYDGDIVLGPADGADGPRSVSGIGPAGGAWPRRRDAAYGDPNHGRVSGIRVRLWPGGVIPYEIDDVGLDPELVGVIEEAIDNFNSSTVLRWIPRTTEQVYVRFIDLVDGSAAGRAHLGALPGESNIWISQTIHRRSWPGVVHHEMGHAAGLFHEHERTDAAQYIDLVPSGLTGGTFQYDQPGHGPYDYASTMQYTVRTKPHGIVTGFLLSAGDIDGIARMYGRPPQATTISTHPPGMFVTVDGEDYRTPVEFHWPAGSQHALSVPGYVLNRPDHYGPGMFARWSDGGSRQHSITADPSTTWFTAYYAVRPYLRPGSLCSNAWPEAPTSPESRSGFDLAMFSKASLSWAVSSDSRPVQSDEIFPTWPQLGVEGRPVSDGHLFREGIPLDVTLHAFARTGTGTVPVWFGSSIPELHGKYGNTEVTFGADSPGRYRVAMVPAEPDRILIEDQPRELRLPIGSASADYLVPYWTEMDGLTVDIISPQADDLTILTNLPAQFRRTPSGFKAVVDYRTYLHSTQEPGELVGNMFIIRVVPRVGDYRGRAERTFSGTVRVHSVNWRRGPARFGDRSPRLFEAESGFVPSGQSVWVGNESGRPARVRLESDRFQLATAPDVLELTGSDAQRISFAPLTDGLEPGMHEGTVRLVGADSPASSTGLSEEIPVRVYVHPPGWRVRFRTSLVADNRRPEQHFYYGDTIEFEPFLGCRAEEARFGAAVLDLEIGDQLRRVSGYLGSTPLRYVVQAADRDADGPVSVRVVGFKIGEQSLDVSAASLGILVDGSRQFGDFLRVNPPANGVSYLAGEGIELTYSTRSSAVRMSGTSEVALNIGGRIVPATLREIEGAELRFRYVVQDGDLDADGLAIARAVIRTADGAEFNRHDDLESLSASSQITRYRVDGSRRVGLTYLERVQIRTGPDDEVLAGIGATVGVEVEFSHAVEVTGSPELGLEIGGRRVRATLVRASRRFLSFAYTVRAEDSGAVTLPPGALLLTGGAVRALDGQAAVLDLAPEAFVGHSNSEWRVDGSEGLASLTGVEVDPPAGGGTFRRGEQIRVTLQFSAPIEVTGIPLLAVEIGSRTVQLVGTERRGTNRLVFSGYEVQAEDRDDDGISIYGGALSVYGGFLADARDESAAVKTHLGWLAIRNSSGHKVNGRAPIRANWISEALSYQGARVLGDRFEIYIDWPEAVTLTLDPQREPVDYNSGIFPEVPGAPQLALVVGNRRVTAVTTPLGDWNRLEENSGTKVIRYLQFHYEVQAGDFAPDGIEIPADGLSLNGATIRDRYGVDVDLDLSHLNLNGSNLVVDARRTVPPVPPARVTGVRFIQQGSDLSGDYSSFPVLNLPHDSTYRRTNPIHVEVEFSDPVSPVGTPRLALAIGDRQVEMDLVGDSRDGRHYLFRYSPQVGDSYDDGLVIPSGTLPITGGTFEWDAAADLTWDGTARSEFSVDGNPGPPRLISTHVVSSYINRYRHVAGQNLSFFVHFDQPVHVTGSPQLAVEIGGNRVLASLLSDSYPFRDSYPFSRWLPAGDGTKRLRFRYEIRAGDSGRVGIPASPLSLNGGAIRGILGDEAVLTVNRNGPTSHSPYVVTKRDLADVVPQLLDSTRRISVYGSRKLSDDVFGYGFGDPINVCLAFLSPVEVTGRPQLALEIGGRRAAADFFGVYWWIRGSSGAQAAPNGDLMCFQYTVQAEDRDLDGLSIPIDPLSLNGGTIRGLGGKDALVLLQQRYDTRWQVDGSVAEAPRIVEFNVLNPVRGTGHHVFGPGDEIIVSARFDRSVQVTGSPQLALVIGDRRVQAGFLSPVGSVWRPHSYPYLFRYVVQAGDRDEDGIVIPADGLSLNGGSIGNGLLDAVLDGERDRHLRWFKVGVAPTIVGRWVFMSDTASGREISFRVRFNDVMEVTGRPTWAFELGRRVEASFYGVMGSDLCFNYSVQPGDLGEDSVITIQPDALSLNGGSIRGRHADARLGNRSDRPRSFPVNSLRTVTNRADGPCGVD